MGPAKPRSQTPRAGLCLLTLCRQDQNNPCCFWLLGNTLDKATAESSPLFWGKAQ